ncbi:hypothetical protein PR001_g4764 [Phytophthora rubi]|uniref:Reverse transcriptase domain-containing protein n=1 Tax=Phytophthora rubi TaxID=129364 RepID=A0A6A3NRW5_9STRA|nr:hypothetical protein PR001_g4764 [Phytophthora rubi]
MAATANLQSAVPAAPKTPGRQHVPPVLAPAPARHVPAAAGKRRRLNSAEDEDMDAEQTTVTAPPPDPMTPPTPAEPALDPATAAAAPTATAPPPTARSTRWGPRPRAPDPTQATTGEPATDPAARRPLAPAAPVTGATRWGPSHRAIGAAAIARLVTGLPTAPAPPARRPPPAPSPPPSADEQQPAAMDVDAGTPAADDAADGPEPWLLRFDGACRRNPGPGGAGAALVDPSGKVVWTCSHYMPSSSETNNTAEYTALLLGVQSAVHHHAEQLTIEGDSHLVVTQVRGTFACRNQRLHQLRNRVRHALRSVPTYTLRHIDRKANAHADRLANRAFDLKRTLAECGMHQGAMADCLQPTPANQPQHERPAPPAAPSSPASPATAGDTSEDDEAEVAARDGGEVFPTIPIGPDSTPVRQPRLRLRPLSDDDLETAAAAVERFAAEMACRITDADSWATGEGYIGAIPDRLREVLQPFASTPPTTRPPQGQQRQRPPRVTRNQREHRLDEALDDLAATQQATPTDSRAMRRARRRVGRIRSSMTQQQPRQDFVRDEAKCVARILRSASAESAAEEQHDTCPIGREELHRHFTGTSAVRTEFDYADERGQEFREALAGSEQATEATDAFGEEFTLDEIEDQLTRAATASSPGHDGIGYDIYRRFTAQLLRLLHTTFGFCWRHRRVPALWKLGFVRLIHKKGDPSQPNNLRPICLQPIIYKLYSGLLARRLSRFLELNDLLPMAQKDFRAFNGCHEHNFVATTLLDQSRRLHRKLYQVWYDLRNAFGSLPQELMWRVLRDLGVDRRFIQRCKDIYAGSAFVIGNAADGATDPVRQEVGVYQGCPLSPLLFIVALVPLLRRIEQLDGVGVPLADGVRPRTTAYADDLEVLSDSAAGIRKCHGVVARFLAWTGLRANPSKCASLSVTTNARGNLKRDVSLQLEVHDEAIATLSIQDSYRYLGVGDRFDHVRHRLQLAPKIQQIKQKAVALMQSGLAPWQVVKALKTYVYPKVEYALRHLRPLQSQLQGFDRAVTRGLRHLLRLPRSATSEFFYTPASSGGLGLQSLVEMHQALQVAHAWQMLHSKDPAVVAIATAQRILRIRHLQLEHRADTHDPFGLRVPHHDKWLDHKTVLRHVRLHMKIRHQTRWKGLVDQGKTVRVHGGPGAKFVSTGAGMSDDDYRFGVKAPLNQVDTNSVLKRKRQRSRKTCRDPTCSEAETLAHVLNHCASNMDAIRQRHDDALEQIGSKIRSALERAKSTAELRLNQTVPEYTGAALRPNIVLRNVAAKRMVIADLAVTFEEHAASARHSSLQLSHDHKTLKYQPIVVELRLKGWQVQTAAIVYGSLGSVQPSNFKTYTEKLKLHKREARQLDLQLSSHCIRASHRIWGWHCRRHREGQRSGNASRAPRGSGGTPRRTSQARARR